MRDLASSRWGDSGADRKVREHVLGHIIDKNEYEKMKYRDFVEREYLKALPWLNILSEDPEKISRSQVDAELEGTKHELELMRNELARERQERAVMRRELDEILRKMGEE